MPGARVFRIKPAPIIVTRVFAARRAELWRAWSEADRLRTWFAPQGFDVSAAEIDFRIGGAFSLHLRTPDGHQLVSRGAYSEIAAPDRLGFRSRDGRFSSDTTVTLADCDGGTLLTIHQDYEVYAPGFLAVVAGAPDAWRTTLDKLDASLNPLREAVSG